jgi:hypothetical protein
MSANWQAPEQGKGQGSWKKTIKNVLRNLPLIVTVCIFKNRRWAGQVQWEEES